MVTMADSAETQPSHKKSARDFSCEQMVHTVQCMVYALVGYTVIYYKKLKEKEKEVWYIHNS